jgi:hypothetical protein
MIRGKLYRIEEDIPKTWVADWAVSGTEAIEAYLANHLEFLDYLDNRNSGGDR